MSVVLRASSKLRLARDSCCFNHSIFSSSSRFSILLSEIYCGICQSGMASESSCKCFMFSATSCDRRPEIIVLKFSSSIPRDCMICAILGPITHRGEVMSVFFSMIPRSLIVWLMISKICLLFRGCVRDRPLTNLSHGCYHIWIRLKD